MAKVGSQPLDQFSSFSQDSKVEASQDSKLTSRNKSD